MTNAKIRSECEEMYKQIKDAEDRLRELRQICKHEDTFEGNYSYRIGNIQVATICSYCNTPIHFLPNKDIIYFDTQFFHNAITK